MTVDEPEKCPNCGTEDYGKYTEYSIFINGDRQFISKELAYMIFDELGEEAEETYYCTECDGELFE